MAVIKSKKQRQSGKRKTMKKQSGKRKTIKKHTGKRQKGGGNTKSR